MQLFFICQMDLRQIAAVCVPVKQGIVSRQQMLRFFGKEIPQNFFLCQYIQIAERLQI